MHVLASTIGQIFAPVFHGLSWLLAVFYSLIPNYVVAIAMLTITVMIISFPLNRASTRSMFKMQLLQPEVAKLRSKYKPSRDTPIQERQEMRQKLNEEMMALYRENNVSMVGGCLPNLVIFPIFIVLYDVIRGLTNTCTGVLLNGQRICGSAAQIKAAGKHTFVLSAPRYINENTAIYRNLHAANGKMIAFGINLASSVRSPEASWVDVLPFVAVVLVAVVLQYLQLRQMTGRNAQTGAGGQANQQMQAMQKFMPLIMALIYISVPAAVTVYFIFSSLFRIGQQEWMFKRDPQIVHTVTQLKSRKAAAANGKKGKGAALEPLPVAPPPPSGLRGFRMRLADKLAPEVADQGNGSPTNPAAGGAKGGGANARPGAANGRPGSPPAKGGSSPKSGATRPATSPKSTPQRSGTAKRPAAGTNGAPAADDGAQTSRTQPRSQDKRQRKPR